MSLTEQPNKIQSLESLRGIAALIVVICHYISAFYPSYVFGPSQDEPLSYILDIPFLGLIRSGDFAVVTFFVLSGLVLTLRYFSNHDPERIKFSLIKRPFRLLGVVLFTAVISAFLWKLSWAIDLRYNHFTSELTGSRWLGSYWGEWVGFVTIIEDLAYPFIHASKYNGPLWTIGIELYGSLLCYIFLLLFGKSKAKNVLIIATIIYTTNSYYQGFWLGMLVASNYTALKNMKITDHWSYRYMLRPLLIAIILFLGCYPTYYTYTESQDTLYFWLSYNHKIFIVTIAGFLTVCLVLFDPLINKIFSIKLLTPLATTSYSLYATHMIVLLTFSSAVYYYTAKSYGHNLSVLLAVTSSIPILIIATVITHYIADKPSIKLAQWIAGSRWIKKYL